jgi:hypothetical protein
MLLISRMYAGGRRCGFKCIALQEDQCASVIGIMRFSSAKLPLKCNTIHMCTRTKQNSEEGGDMRLFRIQVAAVLAMLATSAIAASPFEISGFTTDKVFSAALETARARGGNCQITPAATQESGIKAQCEYAACAVRDKDGACDPQHMQAMGLTIASQPILRIDLEAPTDSAPLTRIIFIFDGRHDAVKASLYESYGPPDISPSDENSWSHARRMKWTQGRYHLALSDIPKLIALEADQIQK